MMVALEVRGPGSKTDSSQNMSDGPKMASRFSWPLGDRLPRVTYNLAEWADLDLAGNHDVQPVAGLTLDEHGMPAWEVGGLQLAGQRGRRIGFDSLEDSMSVLTRRPALSRAKRPFMVSRDL